MIPHDWIDSAAALEELVETLRSAPLWGFDTEFHREKTYHPRLALMQIVSPAGLALIDPFAVDVAAIAPAFADSTVVVHAADQDLEILDLQVGARPERLFDTQVAAGFLGMDSPSLSNLVHRYLKVQLPKGDRLTDWTARPLTPDQQDYAAADVLHLLDLHDVLSRRLEKAGRLQWALDECAHVLVKQRTTRPPEETWWKLKGSRSLRGRAQGIAQAVSAWRETEAESLDLPPRMVLPDLAILAMAQKPPTDRPGLLGIRGVDGRHLKKGADRRILEAIEKGKALAADDLRHPPKGEPEGRLKPVITTIMGWIAQAAVDLDLNATLLATRADVRDLLTGSVDCRLCDGWRHDVVAEPIRRFMSGDAHIVVAEDASVRMV